MLRKVMLLGISAMFALGLITLAQAKRSRNIPHGSWGGQHIRLAVSNGSARIEYDCANGTIQGPLRIDSKGRFDLRGTHVREHGGPIRVDEEAQVEPAQYTGWTDGKKMKLTVTLVKSKSEIGTFDLTLGGHGRVFKCR